MHEPVEGIWQRGLICHGCMQCLRFHIARAASLTSLLPGLLHGCLGSHHATRETRNLCLSMHELCQHCAVLRCPVPSCVCHLGMHAPGTPMAHGHNRTHACMHARPSMQRTMCSLTSPCTTTSFSWSTSHSLNTLT